ncbi:MAG: cyclodeaminase/cyclohydrolase family protein [Synergistaceae bacterium]|nr:cyclodeaminase/cyclohydrolase family protein [Synergistaceae bacterium]MBQ6740334.1 cyclodeaminase/cyclohydrolase family protein [Synergistaceae bacterium]MBQ9581367.1 cyclodeaminase/cyclohydrolase family protein [Synergistaceae bacterium]MBQ9896919.1 cyclodeaminase/cyclohydrolase family protein [Synergistaceae bacterium]MBR0043395.1 cyclodeaminase/cyclohydrolase family protein [Synergistaceae bacterium]
MIENLSIKEFLEQLGSDMPAPGGGSAAAVSCAMGAALISMLCNLTKGRAKYAEFESLVQDALLKSNSLINKALDALQDDNNAYNAVMAAFKLPKNSEQEILARKQEINNAYKGAVVPPENVADYCIEIMRLAKSLLNKSNVNAQSDLAAGAINAYSGLLTALENVKINLQAIEKLGLEDASYILAKREWMSNIEREAGELLSEIRK